MKEGRYSMKSYIEKELIEIQIKHIQKEIDKVEMIIRHRYDDTILLITLRSDFEVDLDDVETLGEKLFLYKTWYEQLLYLKNQLQEYYEPIDEEFYT